MQWPCIPECHKLKTQVDMDAHQVHALHVLWLSYILYLTLYGMIDIHVLLYSTAREIHELFGGV